MELTGKVSGSSTRLWNTTAPSTPAAAASGLRVRISSGAAMRTADRAAGRPGDSS
jgi:hypothetical protein